jgi:hypothetical protein
VLDVKDRRKITPASDNITVVLCEEFYKTSQELRDSAEGVGNGKKCHLCCLFLRSLQSHNSEDSTPVRQGPFNLELKLEGDRVSMAIRCTETRGHPLRVDVGAGETYHIISLDYAYDAGLDETCRGEEVSPSASSSRIYATMRGWLNECNKHAVCTGCKESWLPLEAVLRNYPKPLDGLVNTSPSPTDGTNSPLGRLPHLQTSRTGSEESKYPAFP